MKVRFLLLSISISLYLIIWTSSTFILDVPYSSKRLAEGIILVIGVGILCSSRSFQKRWLTVIHSLKHKSHLLFYILIMLLLLGLVSSIFADYPRYAFLQFAHYLLLFNFLILVIISYYNSPFYFEYGFLIVIGIAASLYLINVTISYFYTFFIPDFPLWPDTNFTRVYFKDFGFLYPEPFLNFVNIRFFNHLQTWTLPLLALLVIRIPKRYWAFSKIAFIILCGWWMLVFASDARGTVLASFLVLGLIFYYYRLKAAKWLRVHSMSALIGFICYGFFFKLLPLLINTQNSRTAFSRYHPGRERLALWENAIQVILQNPLLGIGPMHFSNWADTFSKHPHNIYMQFLGEWGIAAGMLFMALIVIGGHAWFIRSNQIISNKSRNSTEINVRIALTASLMAALLHGLVSGIINTPLSQIMMVLVVGWMIGLSISEINKEKAISNMLWKRVGLIGINIMAAGFLIWSYSVQVPNLDENRQRYLELIQNEENANRLSPRYWDQGVIGLPDSDTDK